MLGPGRRARPEIEGGGGTDLLETEEPPQLLEAHHSGCPLSVGKTKGVCSHQCSVCLSKDYVRVTTPSAVIPLQEGSQEGVT